MSGGWLFWVSMLCAAGSTTFVAAADEPPLLIPGASAGIQPASAQVAITPTPLARASRRGAGVGATVPRAGDGMFYLDATINGAPIRFLVDTGSNAVVLSGEDAARAGLDRLTSSSAEMQTAGGSVPMRWGVAPHIRVAGHELHDVDVAVPAVGPQVSLMGLSALRQLGPILINGDRLILGAS